MKNLLLLAISALVIYSYGCNSVAQFPINEPATDTFNKGFVGKWKFEEDSNKNNYYQIEWGLPYSTDAYHAKFWDRGGKNRTIEMNIHFTKIGDAIFISIPYLESNEYLMYKEKGYFFLKVIDINKDFTKMTTATVHDSTMWELNATGIRQRIIRNLDNPAYYFDTVHFYKIK